MSNALYVYGIVKSGIDSEWKGKGLNEKNVYTISEEGFRALIHDCKEKAYTSEDPNKIRELIISHNMILNRAMENFGGVIPLHFNTIIKKGEKSSQYNLKKWLKDNKERLEKIWNRIKDKKEYGIRIYYNKKRLVEEASGNREIKETEKSLEGKGNGLSYLLQGKVKSKINEMVQNGINQLKQEFFGDIEKITKDMVINTSRIFIDEKKDLLLSLSVLVNRQQTDRIKEILEKKAEQDFSFHLAGPFAPYSFVEK